MTDTIESLNTRLVEAQASYYAGNPTMSDFEYDTLESQLAAMVAHNISQVASATVLTTVGTNPGDRIPHAHPMRSIENVYTFEELDKWVDDIDWPEVTISGKFDGVSASLTYEKGQLVKAVTRGDGDAGESIIEAIRAMQMIPKSLPVPMDIEIRGELMIKRSTMDELNRDILASGGKPYVSTRNLVAGTIKLKDMQEVQRRKVELIPWEVLALVLDNPESGADSAADRLESIVEFGFQKVDVLRVKNVSGLRAALNKAIAWLDQPGAEYGMDGLVIKVDSCARRRELGMGSKFAKFQVAYKLQALVAETTISAVEWQVGRTGRLCPVATVVPVVLGGATVTRVTLNNATWVEEMGLQVGSRVKIIRSGDVIPKVVENMGI